MTTEYHGTNTLDGEAMEAMRGTLQELRRLWGRYRAADLDRIAAAVEGGQLLTKLKEHLPYGEYTRSLAWLAMSTRTAYRWRQLAATGLNASEIIAQGGITAVVTNVVLADEEDVTSATTDTPVAELAKEEQGPIITEHDTSDLELLMQEAPEGLSDEDDLPWGADIRMDTEELEDTLNDIPDAMDEPIPRPSRTEILEEQIMTLQLEVQERIDQAERLDRELRELKAQQSEYPQEREAVFREQEATISSLRVTLADSRRQYRDLQSRHQAAMRRLNALEEQVAEQLAGNI